MTTEQLLVTIDLRIDHEELIERSTITSYIAKDVAKGNIRFFTALKDKLVELEAVRVDRDKLIASMKYFNHV